MYSMLEKVLHNLGYGHFSNNSYEVICNLKKNLSWKWTWCDFCHVPTKASIIKVSAQFTKSITHTKNLEHIHFNPLIRYKCEPVAECFDKTNKQKPLL